MSYPSVSPNTYREIAAQKGLELLGAAPTSVRDPVVWRCMNCGTLHTKTLRAVRQAKHGCSCYKDEALPMSEYVALGERLGIEWVGALRPRNTKTPTMWKNLRNQTIVTASFYDLAYHHIVVDLRRKLGIFVWVDLPKATRNLIKRMNASEVPVPPDNKPVIGGKFPQEILDRLYQLGVIREVVYNRTKYYEFTTIGRRLLTEASRIDGSYVKKPRVANRRKAAVHAG